MWKIKISSTKELKYLGSCYTWIWKPYTWQGIMMHDELFIHWLCFIVCITGWFKE